MANSRKKCKHCKTFQPVETMVKHPIGTFCGSDCVVGFTQKAQNRARAKLQAKATQDRKKQDKAFRSETRARKEAQKTLTDHKDDAQKQVNRFIKFRDWGKPCVSCDKPHNFSHQRHASHYRAKGNYDSLRFDEQNIHMSCATCNGQLSGNLIEYRIRLISRIGQDGVDRLEGPTELSKWTVEELKAIQTKYRLKANVLEMELGLK